MFKQGRQNLPQVHKPNRDTRQGPQATSQDAKRILILGKSGSGKTNLKNLLLGKPLDPYQQTTNVEWTYNAGLTLQVRCIDVLFPLFLYVVSF